MCKVIAWLGISLDGYIARPDGSVDFLFIPKDYSMAPLFAAVDTAIMGRKTYEHAQRMGGGSFGPDMKTYVLSRSQPPEERDGVVLTDCTPDDLIARIRNEPGKDIWLMGGGEILRASHNPSGKASSNGDPVFFA
jgi:dihydrofolate reductase